MHATWRQSLRRTTLLRVEWVTTSSVARSSYRKPVQIEMSRPDFLLLDIMGTRGIIVRKVIDIAKETQHSSQSGSITPLIRVQDLHSDKIQQVVFLIPPI